MKTVVVEAGFHTTPMLADKGTLVNLHLVMFFFFKQDVRITVKSAVMAMTASSAIQKPQV